MKIQVDLRICPACQGKGYLETGMTYTHYCEKCKGEGFILVDLRKVKE